MDFYPIFKGAGNCGPVRMSSMAMQTSPCVLLPKYPIRLLNNRLKYNVETQEQENLKES